MLDDIYDNKLIKLAYKVAKDKYDSNGIPEAFYVMNSIKSLIDVYCDPKAALTYQIINNSNYTIDDLRKHDELNLYSDKLLEVNKKDNESPNERLKRISDNDDLRNVVINDSYLRMLMSKEETVEHELFKHIYNYLNKFIFSINHILHKSDDTYEFMTIFLFDDKQNNLHINKSGKHYDYFIKEIISKENIEKIKCLIENNNEIVNLINEEIDLDEEKEYMRISFYKYDDSLSLHTKYILIKDGRIINENSNTKNALKIAKTIVSLICEETDNMSLDLRNVLEVIQEEIRNDENN